MKLRTENEITKNWGSNSEIMVSITCTAFNHEHFIEDAIKGFLMQETDFPFEIVINDDASTDKTADIIKRYSKKYPRLFNSIFQEENQYSKNKDPFKDIIMPVIRGKYIAICEGDDYWTHKHKLQEQVDFLEKHPEYGVCVGGFTRLVQSTGEMSEIIKHIKKKDPEINGFTFSLTDMQSAWMTKTLTSVIRTNSFFSRDMDKYQHARDIHLFYELVKHSKAFYFMENYGVYRVHEGGINSMKHGKVNFNAAYNCYKELYEHNRDSFTRYMHYRHTLALFNFNIYHSYEGNSVKRNLGLFREAMKLSQGLREYRLLLTAFIPSSFKVKIG